MKTIVTINKENLKEYTNRFLAVTIDMDSDDTGIYNSAIDYIQYKLEDGVKLKDLPVIIFCEELTNADINPTNRAARLDNYHQNVVQLIDTWIEVQKKNYDPIFKLNVYTVILKVMGLSNRYLGFDFYSCLGYNKSTNVNFVQIDNSSKKTYYYLKGIRINRKENNYNVLYHLNVIFNFKSLEEGV